jgi:hypothetical protein
MWCIVCHNDVVGPEIFELYTRLRKGFIVYHKSNGITTMKKHVELEHNTLIKKFCQKQFDMAAIISLSRELAKKHVHVTPSAIFGFFFFYKLVPKKIMKPMFVSWRM